MRLYKHQTDGVQHILQNKGIAAIFHDIGLGKTLTALTAFRELRKSEPALSCFVICPFSLIEGAWIKEIEKHTNFSYCNLRKTFKPADIYLINYEMLLSKKIEVLPKIPKPILCVADESGRIKSHSAKTSKKLLSFRNEFLYRVVMTGTPNPNNMLELYCQIDFLKQGLLGKSFYVYRNLFFHLQRGREKIETINPQLLGEMFRRGWKYEITQTKRKDILSRIDYLCQWRKREECLDLPPQVEEIRYVEMVAEQKRIYKEMEKYCLVELRGKFIPAPLAITKLMKLREICLGFILKEREVTYFGSAKEKELELLLDEIGDKQVIIWCQYRYEIRQIVKKLGDKCCTLYGETEERLGSIDDFTAGKKQYLIAHPKSGGMGLTFVNCAIQIFHSFDYSYQDKLQCQGRIARTGQTQKCVYIYLITKDTVEENIYQALTNKQTGQEFINNWVKKEGI